MLSNRKWFEEEMAEAQGTAAAIDACDIPRQCPLNGPVILRVSEAPPFLNGMRSTYRALPVRQLHAALGFDEHRIFGWHLDHKLVQALILEHYAPGAMPVTCGIRRFAGDDRPGAAARASLHFNGSYVIKAVMGHSSGEQGNFDRPVTVFHEPEHFADTASIADEPFILQERLDIEREYRVHSIEDAVVEDMTFHRFGAGNIPGERDAPNAFVSGLLAKLPAGFVAGSLLGWDVALTRQGAFRVIEINFSGCHRGTLPGFHCSGYFQDVDWGASMIARLFRYLEETRGFDIQLAMDAERSCPEQAFYEEVERWRGLLRNREYP